MKTERLKILAIDGEQGTLRVLKTVLTSAFPGVVVSTALTGRQGIKLALAGDPDVILLDIVMSECDGCDVCRRLKADKRLRHIPIVFVTAFNTDRENRIRALAAGGEGFVVKPVDVEELTAVVRTMAKIKAAVLSERKMEERLAAMVAERTVVLQKEIVELAEERARMFARKLLAARCSDRVALGVANAGRVTTPEAWQATRGGDMAGQWRRVGQPRVVPIRFGIGTKKGDLAYKATE